MLTVGIGGAEHLVDVQKMPYFAAQNRFETSAGGGTTKPKSKLQYSAIPFFDVINYGVQNGLRHFFRRMPHQLADYHVLCETLDFLMIDIIRQQTLQDIVKVLKTGDSEYDREERREIRGNNRRARDAAFQLLYLLLIGEFDSPVRDRNVAYKAVLYVVSHRRKFKYRTRKMVREAFEERMVLTDKQRVALDRWSVTEPAWEGWQEEENTTEEESDDGFHSDWSY